jgi:chaperone BCS1
MLPILNNQFVTGGLALGLIASIGSYLKSIPRIAFGWLCERLLTTVEIRQSDTSFEWVREWISQRHNSRLVEAGISRQFDSDAKDETPVLFIPRGIFFMRHAGRRLVGWVAREKLSQGGYQEIICFQAWRSNQQYFAAIIEQARAEYLQKHESKIAVYVPCGTDWYLAHRKGRRTLDSVCMANGIGERLVNDARAFRAKKAWYAANGIPYRRGYLLQGPPGNGKTSLAMVLATELQLPIYVANLNNFSDDGQLIMAFSRLPQCVLLIEDIDAMVTDRGTEKSLKITFSGLLNALDGVSANDGRYLMMTTNHASQLDPALIRPGRADVTFHIADSNGSQQQEMYRRFFGNELGAEHFAEACKGKPLSMAALQGMLLTSLTASDAIEAARRNFLMAA